MDFYYNYNVEKEKLYLPNIALEKYMKFEFETYDIFGSWFIREIPKLKSIGNYVISSDEYRPDLISYNLYGDTQYWWCIMQYNAILDEMELTNGKKIKYFDIDDLIALNHEAALRQNIISK